MLGELYFLNITPFHIMTSKIRNEILEGEEIHNRFLHEVYVVEAENSVSSQFNIEQHEAMAKDPLYLGYHL